MKDTKCTCKPFDGNNCPYHFPPPTMESIVNSLKHLGFSGEHYFPDGVGAYTFLMHPQTCDRVRVYVHGLIFLEGKEIALNDILNKYSE